MSTLRCRPSELEKEPILVFMSSAQLSNLKLKNGSVCRITNNDKEVLAVSWLTTKSDLKDGVVGISKWLQERCDIKLGNEIIITRVADEASEHASILTIRPIEVFDFDKKLLWELNAAATLSETYRYLAHRQIVTVSAGRQRKDFEIVGTPDAIYKAVALSGVWIVSDGDVIGDKITFDSIGGLQPQKTKIRQLIRKTTSSAKSQTRTNHSLTSHATGILLYGPAGTGKSSLRKAIEAEHDWAHIINWEGSGSKAAKISASQLVHVEISSKLSALDATSLKKLFNTYPKSTLIVAEIRDLNDLQSFLRTGSAFAHEIEVSIPDAEQRYEILSLLNGNLFNEDLLREASQKTHGYVGDDLSRLLNEIENLIDEDALPVQINGVGGQDDHPKVNGDPEHAKDSVANRKDPGPELEPSPQRQVTSDHLARALTHIRPSALQQVFLEKPNVKWSDIGGQDTFKERLRNAVEWPLKYPRELQAYGIPQKKGILLYGPPGCSKTMLVKALATESDYNFLAVKGAELISMYVGESERATREVFRKARAASPCIIFFDEIDAIARRANDSSMLNVLTTLLNEMDGFEELKDVLVVAATNKPQTIDPALMRPGRFDNVVYIGPPDEATREAIFVERFKTPKFGEDAKSRLEDYVKQTSGLSGAEIVAVCQLAGELAFSSDGRRDISAEDIFDAIRRTPRSITAQMIQEYETWNAERAAG